MNSAFFYHPWLIVVLIAAGLIFALGSFIYEYYRKVKK